MQTLTEIHIPNFRNQVTVDICDQNFGLILRDNAELLGDITINHADNRIEVGYDDAVIVLNNKTQLIDFLRDL